MARLSHPQLRSYLISADIIIGGWLAGHGRPDQDDFLPEASRRWEYDLLLDLPTLQTDVKAVVAGARASGQ